MIRVIGTMRYDTDKATTVAVHYGYDSYKTVTEQTTLYKGLNENYFLYRESFHKHITPYTSIAALTQEAAITWLDKHQLHAELDLEFGYLIKDA